MSTTEVAPKTEGANLLRRNSEDVGWEYGVFVDANNKDKVKCKLCDKVMQGGIYRLKQHVAHKGKYATKCKARTLEALEAKEKCKKAMKDAKWKREEKTVRELELREEVNVSRVGGGESEEVTQQKLNKELWKERPHEVHKYIARWVYTHGIFLFCIYISEFIRCYCGCTEH
jgi:hypothetical protein